MASAMGICDAGFRSPDFMAVFFVAFRGALKLAQAAARWLASGSDAGHHSPAPLIQLHDFNLSS